MSSHMEKTPSAAAREAAGHHYRVHSHGHDHSSALDRETGSDKEKDAALRARLQTNETEAACLSDSEDITINDNENGADRDPARGGSDPEAAAVGPSIDTGKDLFEVGWDNGDADPQCPRSMSTVRKWLITVITCTGSLCVTCASSIYTSSYNGMDAEFGCSRLVATLGLSTFVLGIALGPAWSPLSEFYGRRPIYLGSFVLFVIWIVPSAVAQNIETMIVARFFQGFTGSAFLSVAGGTVSDLFAPDAMQGPMMLFSVAPFIGPSIGPLIGGFINTYTHWRWTHYVMIIWGFVLLVLLFFAVPETYHPVLLTRKARAVRAATGDDRWQAPLEKQNAGRSVAGTVGRSVLRPFALLFYEPMCLFLDLYSAILLGILYLFFGSFPLVLETNHGFTIWQVGVAFLGQFVGMMIGASTFPLWSRIRDRLVARRRAIVGDPHVPSEPEDRLPSLMAGALFVPAGLFLFGWTTYASVPWILPVIGAGIFAIGTIMAYSGIFTFLVDAYPQYAASALAGNAFVRCSFAAAFPLFGVQMYNNLGYQWASSLLAFLTVALMPLPFIFFRFGKQIRGRSRYAIS